VVRLIPRAAGTGGTGAPRSVRGIGAPGDPSTHEVLRRLELTITRRLDGLLHGNHQGLVPGHGSESGETRLYVEGDDVRRIDWNVTARTQVPYIRQTIADRELETWLVVDLSPSLDFGTAACTKRELAVAAAAAVGFLTQRSGNRIGALVVHGGRVEAWPARGGRNHLRALLHRLATAAPNPDDGTTFAGVTDLEPVVRRLLAPAHRRGLAVLISDFIGPGPGSPTGGTDGWARPLRAITARHEVLAIEIVDPRELELPDVGVLAVVDPETGDHRDVQTGSPRLRARYAEAARAQRDAIARALRTAGADHLVLRTDGDLLADLVRFVSLRRSRTERLRRPTR
jgi:uncharacterized protein (DUF58 family)